MTPSARAASRGRVRPRALRWLLATLLAVLLAIASVELSLQLAAWLTHDRSEAAATQRPHRVLCVGDSHTYGAGVSDAESYPSQLRAILERRAPGQYSVTNLGVPGMSTAQVVRRLPEQLLRFRPEVVIVWAGVNDSWNDADTARARGGWRARLRALIARSRLYRLYLVWRHDRGLADQLGSAGPRAGSRYEIETSAERQAMAEVDPNRVVTVFGEDGIEELRFEGTHREPDAATERHTEENLEAIARLVAASGARLILVTYPVPLSSFAPPNRAMRRVAGRHGSTAIDTEAAERRIPRDELTWVLRIHPGPRLYREIAEELAERIATSGAPTGTDGAPTGTAAAPRT